MTSAGAVTRRPAVAADAEFVDRLLEVEAIAELAALPEPVRGDLARMQVRARRASYAETWPDAVEWIVVVDGSSVGRLLLDAGRESVHVVDIRLDVAARGTGIGTTVLREVCADAEGRGLPVTLTVRAGSPVEQWYRRNGFVDAARSDADEADVLLVRPADR
jgi:ribosomal protein S18 acetylase RimI-like enzyme